MRSGIPTMTGLAASKRRCRSLLLCFEKAGSISRDGIARPVIARLRRAAPGRLAPHPHRRATPADDAARSAFRRHLRHRLSSGSRRRFLAHRAPGSTLLPPRIRTFQALQHPHGGSEVPAPDPSSGLEPNTVILCRPPSSMGYFPYSLTRHRLRGAVTPHRRVARGKRLSSRSTKESPRAIGGELRRGTGRRSGALNRSSR